MIICASDTVGIDAENVYSSIFIFFLFSLVHPFAEFLCFVWIQNWSLPQAWHRRLTPTKTEPFLQIAIKDCLFINFVSGLLRFSTCACESHNYCIYRCVTEAMTCNLYAFVAPTTFALSKHSAAEVFYGWNENSFSVKRFILEAACSSDFQNFDNGQMAEFLMLKKKTTKKHIIIIIMQLPNVIIRNFIWHHFIFILKWPFC